MPGCPASVTCGRYTDCTGHILSCGMPCPSGKACITSGGSQSCQPPSCKIGDAASKCGEIAVDSCGVAVNCGGCPAGETCVNNACVTQPPPSDAGGGGCGTLSCSPAAGVNLCGTVSDGCGNTKQCTCPMGQDCTGGVCTAPPPECTGDDGGTGSRCGSISNACGSGQVKCPGCTGNNQCDNGTCTACTPVTCGSATCGEVASNGCGPGVSCGTCSNSEECYMGTCCTPKTCAEAVDAGLVMGCGQVNLGCGVSKDCAPCATGEVCRGGACCTPQTCAEAQDAGLVTGCNPVDLGCGVQQSCMTCVAGQLCQNDTCVTCMPKTCADFSGGCGRTTAAVTRSTAAPRERRACPATSAARPARSSTRGRAACRSATPTSRQGRRTAAGPSSTAAAAAARSNADAVGGALAPYPGRSKIGHFMPPDYEFFTDPQRLSRLPKRPWHINVYENAGTTNYQVQATDGDVIGNFVDADYDRPGARAIAESDREVGERRGRRRRRLSRPPPSTRGHLRLV